MAWGWVNHVVIFIFGWTIPFKNTLALWQQDLNGWQKFFLYILIFLFHILVCLHILVWKPFDMLWRMSFRPSITAAGPLWSCRMRGHRADGPERGTFKHSTHQSPQTGPPPRSTLHRCPESAAVTFWWGVQASGKSTSQGEHQNTQAHRDSQHVLFTHVWQAKHNVSSPPSHAVCSRLQCCQWGPENSGNSHMETVPEGCFGGAEYKCG